jgi:broad specificity phosphatase PhoE
MPTVFFITHPEVTIEPTTPVPRWRLSDRGIRRMREFAASPALHSLGAVWASTEAKAIEAAGLLAAGFGLPIGVHAGLGENDRSSTGFLPLAEFEAVADMFFATPDQSVRGWERASDAQRRVVAAVDAIVANHDAGDLALVAHGGVGTLLLCHLLGVPISRTHDQPGQGHAFAFDAATRRVLHDWRPIAGTGQACDGPS